MNFFLLESVAGATLGIFLSARWGAAKTYAPSEEDTGPPVRGEEATSRESRITTEGGAANPPQSNLEPQPSSLSKSVTNPKLDALLAEARDLLRRAKDLGVDTRFYARTLARASAASSKGDVARAVQTLQRGNVRLARRAMGPIAIAHDPTAATAGRYFLGLGALFFVLFALGFWALAGSLYTAPLLFYLLVAAGAGILAANIIISGDNHAGGILAQVFLLSILVKYYFFYLNPYVYASDAFYQFGSVLGISASGYVPGTLGHYTYFPGFAVFSYAGTSVLGAPMSLFGALGISAQLVMVPVSYLIGREMAGRRVGLLAALLMTFTVFGFLSTHYNAALYGFPFVLLAIYAVLRLRVGSDLRWLLVFWVAAMAAFFSHPINALVLALVLLIRFAYLALRGKGSTQPGSNAIPALSYIIVYGTYLAFIALASFDLFVQTLFLPVYSAPLATAPTIRLQTMPPYAIESAIAPSAVALMFFLVGYALLCKRGIRVGERHFLVLLTAAFAVMPVLEMVGGSYATQSSRFLLYLAIPLVFLGAHAVVGLSRLGRRRQRAAAVVLVLFVCLAFLGSSTYLTNNDARFLYGDVPAMATHITESALSSQRFLLAAPSGSSVYMDFGTLRYFEDSGRAPYPLSGLTTLTLDVLPGNATRTFIVLNQDFLEYGNPSRGGFYDMNAIQAVIHERNAGVIFDTGNIQVYMVDGPSS